MAAAPIAKRPRLIEDADPRTRSEVLAVLDRLVANVRGLVPETDMAALLRIRHSAELALPTTDGPLDLTNHETWLVRQICTDYLPGALEHYIALPSDLASEPVLDGRSARDVLDEQLALIESRLDEMADPHLPARGGRAAQPRAVRRRQPSSGSVPDTARRTCHQRARAGAGRRSGAGSRH